MNAMKPLLPALLGLACAASPAWALDLMQSYRLARAEDAHFQAARADAAVSREALPQARSQLLPNLSGTISRSKNATDRELTQTGLTQTDTFNYFSGSAALSLRQPLFRPANMAAYRQAQSDVEAAEATLENSGQDLMVRLATYYFEALMAEDQLTLLQAQKEAYGAQVAAAKLALKTGDGTRTDIDDAQARLDMALATEVELQENVEYTRHQLQTVINRPVAGLAPLQPQRLPLQPPLPATAETWIKRAEDTNPELRALRASIESARQELDKAYAGHLPTVDLVAQRSISSNENNLSLNTHYATTLVGVQATIPLFAGGYNNAQERKAAAALEKLEQQYEARRRDVGLQVRKEFKGVSEGAAKVKALETAERSADQAVFSNQKGFQAGMRTRVDILNAQQQRMTVKRDLAQARYQYILSRVRLLSLVNAMTEDELGVMNAWLGAPTRNTSGDGEVSGS